MPAEHTPHSAVAQKLALRDQLLTTRNRRPLAEIGAASRAIAGHLLAAPEVRRAATVAAYVSIGTEPGTTELIDALVRQGKRVILPVLQPDNDLDWALYQDNLAPAKRGLLEPVGPSLGVDAIATPDVVLVPGLAVDASGTRLGRGGGSYDRALARVPVGTPVIVLLFDGEILERVPHDDHDRAVTGVCTPSGVTQLSGRAW